MPNLSLSPRSADFRRRMDNFHTFVDMLKQHAKPLAEKAGEILAASCVQVRKNDVASQGRSYSTLNSRIHIILCP